MTERWWWQWFVESLVRVHGVIEQGRNVREPMRTCSSWMDRVNNSMVKVRLRSSIRQYGLMSLKRKMEPQMDAD
jgi:hypothetical protein